MPDRDYDTTDPANVAQRSRTVMWALLGVKDLDTMKLPWFHEPDSYPAAIEHLRDIRDRQTDERATKAVHHAIAEYSAVHEALLKDPRKPLLDELLQRYLDGELGDRTVRYIMDWDDPTNCSSNSKSAGCRYSTALAPERQRATRRRRCGPCA